jgi:hypothetical protein
MLSNYKKIYAIISSNFRYLNDSLLRIISNDIEESEYKLLIKNLKRYKKNLVKISNLINIMLFCFFS